VPTTSTGLSSLDSLLRLNAGLALGSSIVIEEDGTTDYAGAILRCFASEGVLQGHKVFVAAVDPWGAGLPGIVVEKQKRDKSLDKESLAADERMKIAWRYERMGLHGDAPGRIGALIHLYPSLFFVVLYLYSYLGNAMQFSFITLTRIVEYFQHHQIQPLRSVIRLTCQRESHDQLQVHRYHFYLLKSQLLSSFQIWVY